MARSLLLEVFRVCLPSWKASGHRNTFWNSGVPPFLTYYKLIYQESDVWQRKSEEPAQHYNFLHYRWGFPGKYCMIGQHPVNKIISSTPRGQLNRYSPEMHVSTFVFSRFCLASCLLRQWNCPQNWDVSWASAITSEALCQPRQESLFHSLTNTSRLESKQLPSPSTY